MPWSMFVGSQLRIGIRRGEDEEEVTLLPTRTVHRAISHVKSSEDVLLVLLEHRRTTPQTTTSIQLPHPTGFPGAVQMNPSSRLAGLGGGLRAAG